MDPTHTDGGDATLKSPFADLDARVMLGQLREQMFGRSEPVSVGRFEIVARLGRGAHGAVYLAEDERLHRRVAVKLLRAGADPTERARLVREAQVLARLKHPHVLTVHDVGLEADRVYIAMEHVEGGSLADWCSKNPPGSRARFEQLLDIAIGTARGLAAAHDAGVIHRDVKPANILVGVDGRARIADFGLARAMAEHDARSETSRVREDEADACLTQSGAVVGTPAYMAPEQFAGQGDARSDQWGLCAAFWEAAYGRRAFAADSVTALVCALSEPPTPPPAERTEVPRWWREILLRGLRAEPGARWSSVAELADQLERGTASARSRRIAVASGGLLLAAATGVGLWQLEQERRRRDCASRADETASVWNETVANDLHAAMAATGAPFAETSFARAIEYLDAYADEWRTHYGELCVATEVDRERDGELWTWSQRCLSERRDGLAALLDALVNDLDKGTVRRVVGAVAGLAPMGPCVDDTAVRRYRDDENDGDPQASTAVRARLARVRALDLVGRYGEAEQVSNDLYGEVIDAPDTRLRLQVRNTTAFARLRTGQYEKSREIFEDLFARSMAMSEYDLAFEASSQLVFVVGTKLSKAELAEVWARVANGLKSSQGDEGSPVAVSLLLHLGTLHLEQGKYELAAQAFEEVLRLREQMLGSGHPSLALAHNNLGLVHTRQARYEAAEREHARAVQIVETSLGPLHPDMALPLRNLGVAYEMQKRYDEAESTYERMLAIRHGAYGEEHAEVADALWLLGSMHAAMDRLDDATDELTRAVAIRQRVSAPDHPELAAVRADLAGVYARQGRMAAAEREYLDALASLEKTRPDHLATAALRQNLGDFYLDLARYEDAVRQLAPALEGLKKSLGADHPDTSTASRNLEKALMGLAETQLRSSRRENALGTAQRALEVATQHDGGVAEIERWIDQNQ